MTVYRRCVLLGGVLSYGNYCSYALLMNKLTFTEMNYELKLVFIYIIILVW